MKFLVDNQLPAALARFLVSEGHDVQHVLDLKLDEADDRGIWKYGSAQDRVLISKDEDFLHLANRPGASGKFRGPEDRAAMGLCRTCLMAIGPIKKSASILLNSSGFSKKTRWPAPRMTLRFAWPMPA